MIQVELDRSCGDGEIRRVEGSELHAQMLGLILGAWNKHSSPPVRALDMLETLPYERVGEGQGGTWRDVEGGRSSSRGAHGPSSRVASSSASVGGKWSPTHLPAIGKSPAHFWPGEGVANAASVAIAQI